MFMQTHRFIIAFLLVITLFSLILGCGSEDESPVQADTEPPATPRGVRSITGDGQVIVEWFPNGEVDLDGYIIWRDEDGDEEFDLLAEVSSESSSDVDRFSFVDEEVINGRTYSYAVSAVDYDGNESELSPEQVFDTPRPSGNNITLNDFNLIPVRSGFDFSQPARGAIAWDLPVTDVYFGFDTEVNVPYLYSDNFTEMQDMGYHEYFDEVDVSPVRGFTTEFVELIGGHVYALLTPDGNFAKIHVIVVSDTSITFDWAYQIDAGNAQLAPRRP